MRFKRPMPRFSLRAQAVLIAVLSLALWAGLNIWSPTRRLGRLLRADQPAFIRREAAASLGRDIPFWEVDQAVNLLIKALDDPSPRVREYASVGLSELGPRAEAAIGKVIATLNDEDRYARYSAAATLGFLIEASSSKRPDALTALTRALEDDDPEVRLAAAETLLKLGESRKAARTLIEAFVGTKPYPRARARSIILGVKDLRLFVPMLVEATRDKELQRREEAFAILLQIASPETARSAHNSALDEEDAEIHEWAAARLRRIAPSP